VRSTGMVSIGRWWTCRDEFLNHSARGGKRSDAEGGTSVIYGGDIAWAKKWVKHDGILARAR
jgi:hypothetical protein